MIRDQLSLDLHNELIVDNFAGGGGASTGIELALGRCVDIAVNHKRKALVMHEANHPQTRHICEDVFHVDPRAVTNGRRVGLAWFSPDCTHFSSARGGKPKSKTVRGLAWVTLRWAVETRPRVIMLENVPEFRTWGPLLEDGTRCPKEVSRTFNAFVGALTTGIPANHPDIAEILAVLGAAFPIERLIEGLGYTVEFREIRGCDFRAPTIRKRLFMVARCDGQPIVWPAPTHGDPKSAEVKAKQRKPWRTAAECIDFSIPCPSIFLSSAEARVLRVKRPLAPASCRRIAKGVWRYVMQSETPFIVCLTHEGGERCEPVDEPWKTVTGANRGEKGLVAPAICEYHSAKREGDDRARTVEAPLPTQTTENRFGVTEAALAAPFVTEYAQASSGRNFAADEPLRTQCAQVKGGHFAPVVVNVANSQTTGRGPNVWPVDEPARTVTSAGGMAVGAVHVARQFGTATGHTVEEPCKTTMAGGGGGKSEVVASYVARQFGASVGQPVDAPVPTTTAHGGGKSQVIATYIAQHNTGEVGRGTNEPISTLTGTCSHQNLVAASLTKYYGTDQDPKITEPLHTATAKQRFGLTEASVEIPPLTPEREVMARRVAEFLRTNGIVFDGEFATTKSGLVIYDIGMRMFTPRELYNAQGFPVSYIIDPLMDGKRLSKTDQIEMCGNSVCPPVSEALVAANVPELAAWRKGEQRVA